nr:hypothetical protein BaRGS_008719 [Batillaria attramentaria]
MGLKGPTPKLFLGNMHDIRRKGFQNCLKDWEKQYGKTYGLCQTYTMDVMAGTAFGIELDSLAYPDHPFVKMTEKIQNPPKWMSIYFPSLTPYFNMVGITLTPTEAVNYMLHVVNTALKIRRQDPERYPDVLQLLVDTEREQETETQVDPEIDHMKQLRTSASWTRRTGLTDGEMQANLFDFLMAGYDTSATVMYFFLYNLAAHPECVEKVQEEIDRKLGENEVDYWVSTDLPYLDMCMNESLRLYPPACMLDRECSQDTVLGGMHVPKNMLVTLAIYNIHTDPEHWPDPMKFDPERHTPEARASRHPFSFLPFGMGPRNCIGMRKAQMDLKMGVAAILQKFTPVFLINNNNTTNNNDNNNNNNKNNNNRSWLFKFFLHLPLDVRIARERLIVVSLHDLVHFSKELIYLASFVPG